MLKCSAGHENKQLDNVKPDPDVDWVFWGDCQTCGSNIIFVKSLLSIRRMNAADKERYKQAIQKKLGK